jgi:hypothetical protein
MIEQSSDSIEPRSRAKSLAGLSGRQREFRHELLATTAVNEAYPRLAAAAFEHS